MDPGFAAFNSVLFWNHEPKPLWGIRMSTRGDRQLTRVPEITLNLPGFHCAACKLILMDYSADAKP